MGGNKYILIIDDDPVIVMTTRAVLEASGYETAGALDRDEAMKLLAQRKPDLVLCDMMMEAIDTGMKLIREIRAMYPGLAVFLISSIADALGSRYDFSELGFNGFLKKPIDPELMIKTVQDAIGPAGGRS